MWSTTLMPARIFLYGATLSAQKKQFQDGKIQIGLIQSTSHVSITSVNVIRGVGRARARVLVDAKGISLGKISNKKSSVSAIPDAWPELILPLDPRGNGV
jgi:hypothetical protein